MRRVVFIGLGVMGSPMAANLLRAGFDVVGVNRSPAAVDRFVDMGGRGAPDLSEAVAAADVVATMLPDTPDVLSVLLGEDGVLAQMRPGSLVIDFSTIRPAASRELSAHGAARGVGVVDAPVSGGEQGAIAGTLSVMVGGEVDVFERTRDLLQAVGRTIVRVGGPGAGQTVKAANQLIVAGNLQLLAEAIVFLDAHGIDAREALEVLQGGLAGSTVMAQKGPQMLDRDFVPGFRTELHHKDLGIAMEAARERRVAIPLSSAAAQLIGALNAQGAGALDHSALIAQVERLSGRHHGEGASPLP